jgi:hypothetical protein
VVRRHELAVVERELAVGPVEQECVVDRSAVELVRTDGEPEPVLARDLPDPVGVGARDLERRARELRERGLRVLAAGEEAHPPVRRVDGDERLGEEHELGAVARDFGGDLRDAVDRGVAVEQDRLGLGAGDSHGVAHAKASLATPTSGRAGSTRASV